MTFQYYPEFLFKFISILCELSISEVHENIIVESSGIFSSFQEMLLRRRKNIPIPDESFVYFFMSRKKAISGGGSR